MDSQAQNNVPPHSNNPENFLKQTEHFFDTYLNQKVPYKLPEQAKEWIVKYGPWINLVLLVLALPLVLAAFGLGMFAMPFAVILNPFASLYGIISWLLSLGVFILQVVALPGLFNRSIKSWYLVYYAALLNIVASLIHRDFFGLIVGTAISMYILFQIKPKYH